MKYCVMFNPLADNSKGEENARKVAVFYPEDEVSYMNVLGMSYKDAFSQADCENIIICGGDGTLNRLANEVDCDNTTKDIYYFGGGSGNDFLHDIGGVKGEKPILINKYLKNLPTIVVNGMTRKFINGIGYGIDGYCCEEADKIKEKSTAPINYTAIAIKGLLFKYSPTNATIIVDGVEKSYKKVWLAPTMNGRYFGGGMMPTPNQDRLGDGTLSLMVMFGKGRLGTLMQFPKIFTGEHIKNEKMANVFVGRKITVKFDRAVALQIDGETVLNVTEYTTYSAR